MAIKEDIVIELSGEKYIFKGQQFRSLRTGRIASVKDKIELEQLVVAGGYTYGTSVYQDLLNMSIRAGHIPERNAKAREWMQENARSLRRPSSRSRMELLGEAELRSVSGRPKLGTMATFFYDAKYKDSLPYWDKFPTIFIIGYHKTGFIGINLHYLDYMHRAYLMDSLYQLRSSKGGNSMEREDTVINFVNRQKLSGKSEKLFKLCIKKYRTDHVKSRMMLIPPKGWTLSMFLPTQQFMKVGNAETVWKDSREKINKR